MLEVFHIVLLFFGGIFGGLYASTVGGGALVSFPLLILVGLPVHLALGTQRLSAVFLDGFSALKLYKEKKVNLKLAIPLGITLAVGSIIGVSIVIHINEKILNIVIGVLLCVVAFVLFHKDKLGIKEHKLTHKHLLVLFLSMIPLGIYQGFFGAGFGVFIAMVILLFGFSFFESTAMGRVIGACGSLAATIIFAQHGFVNYWYGIVLGSGFAIGSWIGITIALKKNATYIKGLILLVVILSLFKLILNMFNVNVI